MRPVHGAHAVLPSRPQGLAPMSVRIVRMAAIMLGRAVATTAEWHERYRQRLALGRLDDAMLKDIGISRYDALMESRKPFWRR